MKIIISPAKKMNIDTDSLEIKGFPVFLEETKLLMNEIKKLSLSEAKLLWKCNDKLADLNYQRFQEMDLENSLTPAILTYEGLQYQHMAPKVFTEKAIDYISVHLRILSGFYGVLRPFDGVTPYRLEMQAKLSVNAHTDLYEFWGDKLYQTVLDKERVIVNLASKEYSHTIEKYITLGDQFVTVEFGELVDGKLRQKGTFAKMARGEMVRFMAEHNITNVKEIKEFQELGLSYCEERSDEQRYVFLV